MKMSKALQAFAQKAKASDSYWVEAAKLEFAVSLERQRKLAGMTYKAVADKLGTSAAYITKVFRGDTNVTIETMVKLARATGGRLELQVAPQTVDVAAEAEWVLAGIAARSKAKGAPTFTPPTTATNVSGANDERFALAS